MINLTYYFDPKDDSHERIETEIQQAQEKYEFHVTRIDVTKDLELYKDFGPIPLIKVGPYTLQEEITFQQILVAVGAASDRDKNLRMIGDPHYEKKVDKGKKLTNSDKITMVVSKHYMFLFNFVVFLYVGLPFLAPILMNYGLQTPARVIYTIYRPLCHQLTFRSFFIFGEQYFYPRELANVPDVISYEEYFHQDVIDLQFARDFLGNEHTGYKLALCERDMALYGSFLLFGILFQLSARRIKKIPWYIWILFGIFPMGIDGSSQLFGMLPLDLPAWMLIRESTPFLRVLTGGLFGITTAWYLYPMVEDTMKDARKMLTQKKSYIEQSKQENIV
ncbi:MAG: DUF2085 domain-containing protein [Anaerolineaceae bacterium]|nr:DUF2085 domain-containing protein [Anaerolineaceae bacterium]